jgi:hypothetical protein
MKKFKFRSVIEYEYLAEDYEEAYDLHYHGQETPKGFLISSLPVSVEGEGIKNENHIQKR